MKTKLLCLVSLLIFAAGCSKGSLSVDGAGGILGGSSGSRIVSENEVFGNQNMDAIVTELETLVNEQDLTLCQAIADYSGSDTDLKAAIEEDLQVDCP